MATLMATDGMVQRVAPSVYTPDSIQLELAYLLGGRAAERLLCGDISSGSGGAFGSDLDCATSLALSQETAWGLGDNGLMFAPVATQARHGMSATLRQSVNQQLAAAEDLALTTLAANFDLLETVTTALLQSRELDQKQIADLISASPSPQSPSPAQPTSCTM